MTIFCWILTTACCLLAVLGLRLDIVSGWLVVMHTCLYYSPFVIINSYALYTFYVRVDSRTE